MKRLLLSTATALSLLGTGCAATSGAHASTASVALGDSSGEPLHLDGEAITGPHSSLVIEGDGMRGRFRTHPVALKWDYQQMTGSVGSQVTELQLAEGDDTRVWGTFGGLAVDLTEDGTWLHGRVGQCAYALKREGDGLKGMRECGQVLEKDISVSFPQALASRPVGERAALMTLMLVNTKAKPVAPRMGVAPKGGVERMNKFSDCRYASF
ncbi:hypothetical protein JY651_33620 [Pyxidicoccus parkwayensis]|uniref:Lipoprotein n=1 Tax=Pyxidicoccus parkwayensis TaxID=2813578 RepID=A0ABX7NVP0_9BACT|nr:hypothetical protein [Pyxidicoccus parkwaysis]QSQ20183.1 hypothetical protein JY651_33620 [Pyxidicoccus parkwaysis]